ncbi:hypothetical protein RB594_009203 [Gaeumannomyces avenae]
MASLEAPVASVAPESGVSRQQKQRRACDECRTRKLACSKEPSGCARCVREGIVCHYSPQKQMGRPRKRPRAEVPSDSGDRATQSQPPPQQDLPTIGDDTDFISMMPDFAAFDLDPTLADSGPSLFDMLDPNLSATFIQPSNEIGNQVEAGTVGPGDRYSGPWGGFIGLGSEGESAGAVAADGSDVWAQQPPQAKSHPPPQRQLFNPYLTNGIPFSGLDDFGLEPGPTPSPLSLASDGPSTPVAASTIGNSPVSWSSLPRQSQHHQAPNEIPRTGSSTTARSKGCCPCLAKMYLALDSLQNLPEEVGPAMACARGAAKTAWEVTECSACSPPDFTDPLHKPSTQSFQNLMLLGALLPSIANAYNAILPMIDAEAEACRVETAAARRHDPLTRAVPQLVFDMKTYGGLWGRVADRRGDVKSIITAKSLDPDMWRSLVRALLRLDVYGLSAEFPGNPTMLGVRPTEIVRQIGLKDIVDFLLERSRARHAKIDELVAAGEIVDASCLSHKPLPPGQKHACQNVLEVARLSIERLVIA